MEADIELDDSVKDQIFTSPISPYKPSYSELSEGDFSYFHSCVDCGDRFFLESSLITHLNRESVAITYFCKQCDRSLQFQNRCNLLAHLRQHPESNKNSLSILINPLSVSNEESGNSENTAGEINGHAISSKCSTPVQINQSILAKILDNSVTFSKTDVKVQSTNAKLGEVKVIISETQKSTLVNKCVRCRECGVSVENIKQHFLGDNKPFNPKIKCQSCDQILPTKCSLKAHLRIHVKKFPFICPDCMKEFAFYELFMVHLRYFCFHLDKCSRFKCQACPGIFPSLTSLEVHLATRHVKPVYKCIACPRAFFEQRLLNEHKIQSHGDIKIPTKFFEQCQLCPQKLLTKSCLFLHIHGHMMSKNVCFYGYKCSHCQYITEVKLNFASHRLTCPVSETDASAHALAKLAKVSLTGDASGENNSLTNAKKPIAVCLPNFSISSITNSNLSQLQGVNKNFLNTPSNKKVNCGPNGKQKIYPAAYVGKKVVILSNEQNNSKQIVSQRVYKACGWHPQKCLMCQNELTHGTPLARYNCPTNYDGCHKWKVSDKKGAENSCKSINFKQVSTVVPRISKSNEKNCMAFNGPFYAQKLSTSASVPNTYLCHICKHSIQIKYDIIQKHFRQQHPDIKMMSLFPLIYKLDLPKLNIPLQHLKFSVKKSRMYQTVTVKTNLNVPSKGIKQVPKKSLLKVKQSFVQNRNRNTNTLKHWLACSKCGFKTKNKRTHRKHLNSHKSSPYQCPECGLRFVVEPSLRKHLILHHGITKFKTVTKVKNVEESSEANGSSDLGINSSEGELECKVCHKSFENAGDLQKHFRIHGMAFLLLNKDETVWRKV